jgi:hypothetical protein
MQVVVGAQLLMLKVVVAQASEVLEVVEELLMVVIL